MKQLFLIVTGASYGLLSAAGVFTVLVAVGLIPMYYEMIRLQIQLFYRLKKQEKS